MRGFQVDTRMEKKGENRRLQEFCGFTDNKGESNTLSNNGADCIHYGRVHTFNLRSGCTR